VARVGGIVLFFLDFERLWRNDKTFSHSNSLSGFGLHLLFDIFSKSRNRLHIHLVRGTVRLGCRLSGSILLEIG
jgi:hypothetical protein